MPVGIDIGTNYGSIPGRLDVVLSSRGGSQNGTIENPHLRIWDSGFADLTNVAYAAHSGGGPSQVGEVALWPKPGFQVTLNGFDIAAWEMDHATQVTIYDAAFTVLSSSGLITASSTASSHFAPAITRSDGVIIQWGPDSFNVGIDNIDFTVSAVPEAGTGAMVAVGLGLVLIRLQRRRRARVGGQIDRMICVN
ncbi:MAG: hypothetical protein IT531_07775 [Burkholderiales bacterium]|nr:hypothetical protein [Burkholderiales bacterium]